MQLRLKPKISRNHILRNILIKSLIFLAVFFVAIFLIDKIKFPAPSKLIKQEISNEKLIILK
tara:strand:- start:350 stop:535 length:186 start_codon:yes stop_codon:yes gene_type:complete